MNLKQAFGQGLLIGTGANLIADAIAGHTRDRGGSNAQVLMIGLFFFGLFLMLWSGEQN
jgi:hypothetical protein